MRRRPWQRLDHRQPEGQVRTKWLSITSTCSQSALRPRRRPRRPAGAKSADRMLGAIWMPTPEASGAALGSRRSARADGAAPTLAYGSRRSSAMNIASVPCTVRPQLDVRARRRGPVDLGQARARASSTARRRARRGTHVARPRRGLGQVRRAGHVRDHAAGPYRVQRAASSSARCSGAERGHVRAGCRRQRASGRRRSAPSPVHGTSTSTRSKPRAATVAGTSVGDDDPVRQPAAYRRPVRRRDQGRPVRLHLGRQRARHRARTRAPPSSAAFPPGPAHRSSQRRSAPPSTRRAGRSERGQLAALVLDAGSAAADLRQLGRVAVLEHGGVRRPPTRYRTRCQQGSRRRYDPVARRA